MEVKRRKSLEMKFTFKKHPARTGLAGIGYPHRSVDIKLMGKKVGLLSAPYYMTKDQKWGVMIAVVRTPTTNAPAPFSWIRPEKDCAELRFETETEARQWVKEEMSKYLGCAGHNLYQFED